MLDKVYEAESAGKADKRKSSKIAIRFKRSYEDKEKEPWSKSAGASSLPSCPAPSFSSTYLI